MSWSAAQYSKFEDDRTRPVRDLVCAIPPHSVNTAVDLGCGPGNSTEVLVSSFPQASVSGIDQSADMVTAARKRLPDTPFSVADVAEWAPIGRFDIVLSNAVLHWVPDHGVLFPRLLNMVSPPGSLAIQMPDNLEEPVQVAMRTVAMAGSWRAKLKLALSRRTPLSPIDAYYRLLKPHCRRVDIWRTTYHHCLPGGAAAVVEWFKGSGLGPFLEPLTEAEQADYLGQYQAMVETALPPMPDGSILLPFPRLFIIATR